MTQRKSLIATAAAAALVSAIGLAYAQTSSGEATLPTATPSPTAADPGVTAPSSDSSMPSSSSDSTLSTPEPQADRN